MSLENEGGKKMGLLDTFSEDALKIFKDTFLLEEVPADGYSRMRYPKWPVLMRFDVDRYEAKGFGHLMLMKTRAMGGMMNLLTASFTPNEGVETPYLLIDMMKMGKKRTVFVEYYDCTGKKLVIPELDAVKAAFSDVPEYAEKPAWYIAERMPCSLIKGTADGSEGRLLAMVRDSLTAYTAYCKTAPKDPENLSGLHAFQSRMITEGNPSSGTMDKVLGKDGAERFFKTVVMPVPGI